jgi:hypothetical protein
MNLRHPAAWLSALLACVLLTGFLPSAHAQRNFGPPEIDAFYVESDGGFAPGAELTVTVEGTPRGQASAQIRGVGRPIPLTEVQRGIYKGRYTISRNDRVNPNSSARATLRVRDEETTATLDDVAQRSPRRGEPPPPAAAQGPSIERFSVAPIDRIEPGAELKFTLLGTPRGNASFTIEGVATNLPMREVKSGVYEGDYTIRRQDKFPAAVSIVATLEADGRRVPMRLNQPLLVEAKPPPPAAKAPPAPPSLPLEILSHPNNAEIGRGATEVRGRTAPDARVDVQVQSVSSLGGLFPVTQPVLNQTLRADPAGNFVFRFQPQLPLPGTRFEIAVNASKGDLAKDLKLVLIQQR